MARGMKLAALVSVALTVAFILAGWEAAAITAGTCAYHFVMRLAVGGVFNAVMGNRADPQAWWFRPRPWEEGLYGLMRVGRWKAGMPTYDPAAFDRHRHSWDEITQAMCQAELVHETIILLSFAPLAAIPLLGGAAAFVITSVLAAAFDGMFVIMQRYNRPRILRIARRVQERKA